jgi:hypothetical protein
MRRIACGLSNQVKIGIGPRVEDLTLPFCAATSLRPLVVVLGVVNLSARARG